MASVKATKAGGWRVSVCKQGVRDTRTFPVGTTKKEAGDWGTVREAEIIEEAKAPKVEKVEDRTMRELIKEWMAGPLLKRDGYATEITRCKWFLENLTFLDITLRELEAEDIEEWIAERERLVGSYSILRDMSLLGPILKWAVRKKWITTSPLKMVEMPSAPEARDARIGEADTSAMLEALGYTSGTEPATKPERLAVAFLLALETGMRRGEMLKTTWNHVHEDYIHLPAKITKNRGKRDVPLSQAARALIRLLPRTSDALLGDLNADTADKLFRAAASRAQRAGLHFHDTRHEAVTRLARKLDVLPLARMIGHRDLNSLKIYYNATPQEIAPLLG